MTGCWSVFPRLSVHCQPNLGLGIRNRHYHRRMHIVLNTRADDAGTRICIDELGERLAAAGVDAAVGNWNRYDRYDVAVFMGYDEDAATARAQNPSIRVVLMDPKLSRAEWIAAARDADQLVVSSVEQRDILLRLNRNVLIHYMFPRTEARERKHVSRDELVVVYHGNRVHLEAMVERVKPALEELGRRRRVAFRAVYNIEALGHARVGVPDKRLVRVEHIQWTPQAVIDAISDADVGIITNELPVSDRLDALERIAPREGEFKLEPFDHLLRLKASANPGRMYPFARLGVPVVADFAPSSSQLIVDGRSGFVVSSVSGWLYALEALADSPELRTTMATALRERVDAIYERQVDDFLAFCRAPLAPPPPAVPGELTAERELSRLPRYRGPRGPRGLPPSLIRVKRRLFG